MKLGELFQGIVENKVPSIDIINTIEEIGNKKNGVTKGFLNQILSDFSFYLQEYVDLILEKRKTDSELIEGYKISTGEDNKWRNFYVIQEHYSDANLNEWQKDSVMRFCGIIYRSIKKAEYLTSDNVTMADSIGDSYKEGLSNSFFAEVHKGGMSDLEIYSRVQELTGDFDPVKIKLLCKDFDFYFWWERELWEGKFSHEEIQNKINEYEKDGKEVPMLSDVDRGQRSFGVSDYFKPQRRIKRQKEQTEEQKKNVEQFAQEMSEMLKNTIDISRLMDPHGIEFYSLYRLRSLLVQLKAEYTTAELKPKFQSKLDRSTPKQESVESNIQPIHWLKGDESLRMFLQSIKKVGLIENRDTNDLIQEHFRQADQTPQPIQWSKTNRLLIYLFNKLSEAGLIDTMDRQFKLITDHFLDRHRKPFKRDSIKQDSQNMKYSSDPRGSKTIDSIIQSLSDKPLQ
ncbi:hypothetical protein [Gracilimonas mengyeensis]|uniref:Uncharacterized protein n=1 Tax=Gracilimonas mengyeensis TaxID=1302730 RepID=A0A521EI78_9BACT|nr:hypothetical protein [Gracilimonas mengyeensis]SMO83627.1 hypothetical protein SAMN06265219_11265 [Gracilimonas mengyeensis]